MKGQGIQSRGMKNQQYGVDLRKQSWNRSLDHRSDIFGAGHHVSDFLEEEKHIRQNVG
ncbi:hypothetical protein [Enterocloster clostridioformis]|jgi:hypothetical protein|uniref:hypothetical protein n=1 Tax=Enterocloster clostridioformis TaxID=1531 RepID=UPI0003A811AD|nr:hypothetical protein [Enterocloster clostridioformis]MDY4765097.1 hypothetical protein [Enterocloster clostridioformis]NSJ17785.1 hypothetical protein [Enterocloster clostridioformis]NSJ37269.1 hypothetical protein [Enterocloster clostridioformis]